MVRDCFIYRGTLPCQCSQATECRWHHCWGRHRPHSSKRCSGVEAASALSKVIASGLHSWSAASPSFTSHHPAAGLAHGFPVLLHKHHWPPPVLSSACWKQMPLSVEGQGQCCRRKKVPYLLWRCCGNSCNPAAPMSELYPTLIPISPSRWAATTVVRVWLPIHAHLYAKSPPCPLELYASILRGKWIKKKTELVGKYLWKHLYKKESVSMTCFFFLIKIAWRKGKIILEKNCYLLQFLDGFPNLYF